MPAGGPPPGPGAPFGPGPDDRSRDDGRDLGPDTDPYGTSLTGLFDDDDDDFGAALGDSTPPGGRQDDTRAYRHARPDEATGQIPAFEAPVPRRVDLPDDVFAPRGTAGRRLADPDEEYDPYAPPGQDRRAPYPPDDRYTPGYRDDEESYDDERHADGRYPDDGYPDDRYPDDGYPDDRYVDDDRYADDERYPHDERYPDDRYADDRYRDQEPYDPEEEAGSRDIGPAIGIAVAVVVGLGLAAAGGMGITAITSGLIGSIGAAVVVAAMTSVVVRRAIGVSWWIAALSGTVPAALVLARDFGPSWAEPVVAVYAAGIAGAAGALITAPVRRLSELVLEYVFAFGMAFAGGGAVAGILQGEPLGQAPTAFAIALGFTIAMVVALRAQVRLAPEPPSGQEKLFHGGVVVASVIGALACVVLFGFGTSLVARAFGRIEDILLDFRLIVVIPLAILGSGVVVRAFTSAGWWLCASAAISTSAIAAAFGAVSSGGRADIAPTLASSFVGYVLGFFVTVAVAFFIGMRMRSAAARARRGGTPTRMVDEPGRLGGL